MAEFDANVVFSPGAPLDVNKLNQLQSNIASVYEDTRNFNTINTKSIGGLETTVKAIPIVEVGTTTVNINKGVTTVTLNNTRFANPGPTVVATIKDNLKPKTSYSVRARATDAKNIIIEVTSPDATLGTIDVNYIAIQMLEQ